MIENLVVPYRLHQEDFEAEAKSIGLGGKMAMRIFDEVYYGFKTALQEASSELEKLGFEEAPKLAEKISKSTYKVPVL